MTGYPEAHRPTAASAPPLVLLHGGGVANWMWEPQVPAFGDRLVLALDLPGFGARVAEGWPGFGAAADAVVERASEWGATGPFDVVGLSLGALTALHLLARHPDRVRSAFVTGAPLTPAGAGVRAFCAVQSALCGQRWYWSAQARAFGLPREARGQFVEHGLSVRRETLARMSAEVCAGGVPAGLDRYAGPLLAVAGEKESAAAHRSLPLISAALPQAEVRHAPGMHHIWNIEDVDLFTGVLRTWLAGHVDPRLIPA